jgi:type IX secretion system PorP/SprF family membrane protein
MTRIILLITIGLTASCINAQPRFGNENAMLNYSSNAMLINPANTASNDSLSTIALSARLQWLNVEGRPISQNLQFQTAAIAHTGLGFALHNDSYGVNHNMQLSLHYARKIKLKQGTLSFGLQLGALTCGEGAVTDLNETADPVFARASVRSWGFNAGAGAAYRTDKWFAGISIPQLMTNDFDAEQKLRNELKFDRLQYILAGGYAFDLSSTLCLQPFLLMAFSPSVSTGYEFMLTAFYRKRFEFGAGLSTNAHLQVAAGLMILKNLSLRYQYGQSMDELQNHFSGTHIISFGYRL